ncbi:MAG: hypothetical protein KIS66_08600 [Fimbriimonadaceae bacterium]|nr:hypothetical protein [Fimbriimonadaceae bacterium]
MSARVVVRVPASDPALARLVEGHPYLDPSDPTEGEALELAIGGWKRRLYAGSASPYVRGLVELMDNNPLVCADEASVPGPAATLALIGLGPLARAGILADEPAVQLNFADAHADLHDHLRLLGYDGEVLRSHEDVDLGSVLAATVLAPVQTPDPIDLLDDLYDECFGRSFFVRRAEDGPWEASRVADRPFALYRLRVTPGEPTSLLTIQVMADRDGKCGAGQRLHALNVMCGFEEDTGLFP